MDGQEQLRRINDDVVAARDDRLRLQLLDHLVPGLLGVQKPWIVLDLLVAHQLGAIDDGAGLKIAGGAIGGGRGELRVGPHQPLCDARPLAGRRRYFCSSTNRICELTKLTPGTANADSFNFIRNAVFVSSGTSNGSRVIGLAQVVTTLSARASTTFRDVSTALARAMATAFVRRRARRGRVDTIGGGEAPRAVHQHAQAEPVARRPRDVLDLPFARRDRFAAVAIDADVGVRRAERRRPRQRRVRGFGAPRVVVAPG